MKSFEKVQSDLIAIGSMICSQKDGSDNSNSIFKQLKDEIDNAEEITTIEIGASTNALIEAIKKAYRHYLYDYWHDFDKFMNEYIIGITPDGKYKSGTHYGTYECLLLGIGIEELSCFRGKNPLCAGTCNFFRDIVNANFGTNIPMSGVEYQAMNNYKDVIFSNDTEAKDKALICLREVQRNSGSLKYDGEYHLLSTDKEYQDAKARCSGSHIKNKTYIENKN